MNQYVLDFQSITATYLATGAKTSITAPMSPPFMVKSCVSQPSSSLKPMANIWTSDSRTRDVGGGGGGSFEDESEPTE